MNGRKKEGQKQWLNNVLHIYFIIMQYYWNDNLS